MDDERALAEHILRTFRRVAVVGVSDDTRRPSHEVASYLRGAGYDIVPVNPNLTSWEGLPCHPDLRAVPGPIEVVDVFRRSELVDPIVDDAIAVGARAAGLLVVMNRCMLRDHSRFVA
jgi:predicted CoA-binding protein